MNAVAAVDATWTLCITRARSEHKVAERLGRFLFDYRLFTRRVTRVWHGRKSETLVPAFPRYLFVRVAAGLWQTVLAIKGVIDFVRHLDLSPIAVPAPTIEHWSRLAPDGVLPYAPEDDTAQRFARGARIRIIAGNHVASGCEGVFEFTTADGKACVLMPWLGRMVPVEVPEGEIEPLEPAPGRPGKAVRPPGRRKRRRGRTHHQHVEPA